MSAGGSKVLLLYGAGANVGAAVLKKFAANGWKTAAVVRTMKDEYKNSADLVLQVDFAKTGEIQKAYSDVESKLGTPNVVVYNAYALNCFTSTENPFSASADGFATDITVAAVGLYAAASSAAAGFTEVASGEPRVFVFTGNGFPTSITPEVPGLGAGKAAGAYLMESAARALGDPGKSNWYFADERFANGYPVMMKLNGEAHGEMYYKMTTEPKQGPWNYTFVKGKGYVRFDDVVDHKYTPVQGFMEYATQQS